MFRAVAESAVTLLGAKLARVWMDDPQSRVLRIEYSSGLDPGVERMMSRVVTLPYGSGLAGRVFVSRTPEYLLDVQEDPRWLDKQLAREARLHDRPLLEAVRQSPAAFDQPVVLRWRRKDGALIWTELRSVPIHDEAGNVVAIEGMARDVSERMRVAQLRQQLLNQVLTAQEEERARIARELHDETGQSLASLVVGLSALANARTLRAAKTQAGELRGLASLAVSEVRRLAWGLRPRVLDDLGLVAALERYAAEFARSRGIRVDVRARDLDERLPSQVESA